MTPDIARRCAVSLYAAMAVAVGCGLLVVPPFDWLGLVQRLPAPAGLLAGAVHAGLAWWAASLCLRTLADPSAAHGRAAPLGRASRLMLMLTVALAWGLWLVHLQWSDGGDARALLWLQLSPLWLWPAGLRSARLPTGVRRPVAAPGSLESGTPKPRADATEHLGDDLRPVDHVDMGRPGHAKALGTRQHRRGGREHDVVAVAEAAQEQAAA